jgi:hypothetical protein
MIQLVNFCANEKCWRNVGPDRYALSTEADFCPDCGIMTTLSRRRAVEFFTSTKWGCLGHRSATPQKGQKLRDGLHASSRPHSHLMLVGFIAFPPFFLI